MLLKSIKLFLLGLLTVACGPALGALSITVDVNSHSVANNPDAKAPADSRQEFHVVLANSSIVVKSPLNTTVLDFKGRRRFVLDPASKSYVSNSLFDTVGFRVLEMQNRENMNSMLAAIKADPALRRAIDIEQSMALMSRSPGNVTDAVEGDELVFSSEDRQLGRWTNSGFDVAPEDAKRFAQFVRYTMGGHPSILKRLSGGHQIPKQISLVFNEAGWTRTQTIAVTAVAKTDWDDDFLKGYMLEKTSRDSTDALLDRAAALTPDAFEQKGRLIQAQIDESFQEGRILDAFLGWMERNLMTGKVSPVSPEQIERFKSDENVRKISAAVPASSKESMEPAIKTFAELKMQAGNKSYVLGIFEANDRLKLGDVVNARKLFEEALENNLFLTGVYKDLGDLFLLQYDAPHAWRCWDQGRRLAPDFGNFAAVNQFEQNLFAQHPEYFE